MPDSFPNRYAFKQPVPHSRYRWKDEQRISPTPDYRASTEHKNAAAEKNTNVHRSPLPGTRRIHRRRSPLLPSNTHVQHCAALICAHLTDDTEGSETLRDTAELTYRQWYESATILCATVLDLIAFETGSHPFTAIDNHTPDRHEIFPGPRHLPEATTAIIYYDLHQRVPEPDAGAGDQLTNTLVVDVAVRSLMRMLDRQRHHLVDLVVTEPAAQEGQHREMILLRITLRATTTKPVQHRFQRVTDPPPTLIAEQYERDPSTPKVVQPLSPRGASIGGTPLLPRTLELRICPVQPINAPEGQGAQRHPTLYTTEPPALQH